MENGIIGYIRIDRRMFYYKTRMSIQMPDSIHFVGNIG